MRLSPIGLCSIVFALVGASAGCQSRATTSPPPSAQSASQSAPPSSPSAAPAAAKLTRVSDPSLVCMVNDQFMGKPQIPVEVAGKTYFGCCAMCKEKLAQQESARTSKDPVTGASVDKATAVIAQDGQGRVLYFASEQTLSTYNARP